MSDLEKLVAKDHSQGESRKKKCTDWGKNRRIGLNVRKRGGSSCGLCSAAKFLVGGGGY